MVRIAQGLLPRNEGLGAESVGRLWDFFTCSQLFKKGFAWDMTWICFRMGRVHGSCVMG